jgi:hypothetical protein
MTDLTQNEIEVVSGGIIPLLLVCALLSGCSTLNGPDNQNLKDK